MSSLHVPFLHNVFEFVVFEDFGFFWVKQQMSDFEMPADTAFAFDKKNICIDVASGQKNIQ